MIAQLDVLLYGTKIGSITLLPGDRSIFIFDDAYVNDRQRPILSLSFLSQSQEIITSTRPTQTKLSPFFSNLLPEGHLRTYLAAQAKTNPEREFYLLQALGEDLAGAVTIKTTQEKVPLQTLKTKASKQKAEDAVLHFSLAGVQMKFSALMATQGGLTVPAQGVGGQWITKLPSPRFPQVPENEYLMLQLAKEIGIDIPPTQLVNMQDITNLPDIGVWSEKKALAIKRFDRHEDGSRIHIEDFAQVYNIYPQKKYDKVSYNNIAKMLFSTTGEKGVKEFIKRFTFNTLIGNGDMHLKNWSFIYPDRRTPQLAPGYDFVSTIPYISHPDWALSFANTKSMLAYDLPLLKKFIEKTDLPPHLIIDPALETAAATLKHWQTLKKQSTLSSEIITLIDRHMHKIPLLKHC